MQADLRTHSSTRRWLDRLWQFFRGRLLLSESTRAYFLFCSFFFFPFSFSFKRQGLVPILRNCLCDQATNWKPAIISEGFHNAHSKICGYSFLEVTHWGRAAVGGGREWSLLGGQPAFWEPTPAQLLSHPPSRWHTTTSLLMKATWWIRNSLGCAPTQPGTCPSGGYFHINQERRGGSSTCHLSGLRGWWVTSTQRPLPVSISKRVHAISFRKIRSEKESYRRKRNNSNSEAKSLQCDRCAVYPDTPSFNLVSQPLCN